MTDITNALRKLVRSLSETKNRREHAMFMAEGTKCVSDTAGHFRCRYLLAKRAWMDDHSDIMTRMAEADVIQVSTSDLERMTQLTTPPQVIAVYDIPQPPVIAVDKLRDSLVVALDRIQDPGNLGTIIRLCDWMGMSTILASMDTADVWSPKVVQATMGGISRVKVVYCDLAGTLAKWPAPVYGTFLDAPCIYDCQLDNKGVIVFGNEGRGISDAVKATVTRQLFIPSFPPGRATSESLNVATAAAITISEFRRREFHQRQRQ